MGVETVLQAQQDVPRLPGLAPPGHVPEVVEPLDAGGDDDQRLGSGVPVRAERVDPAGGHDEQVAWPGGDDVVAGQDVERAVEDEEQLGRLVVTIRLSHGAASALARAAADAELDIAFIDGPVDPARLTRTELGRDYLVLAVPRGDPLARQASIRLDDPALRDRDFVEYRADSALRAQIDAACAAAGLSRRITCEVENMQYLVESVQHGLGVTVLPPMAIHAVAGQVDAIPITPPLHRDLCAVVATGRPPTGAAQALLSLLAAGLPGDAG
jgi:DNA-binding transcriptional LysR family regulator